MAADMMIHAVPKYWDLDKLRYTWAVFKDHTIGSDWSTPLSGHITPEDIQANDKFTPEEKKELIEDLDFPQLDPEERPIAQLVRALPRTIKDLAWHGAYDEFARLPSFHVGEVSWLKAALFEDSDKYIPDSINAIHELIGEHFPILDEDLKAKLLDADKLPNQTTYQAGGHSEKLAEFLDQHMGERLVVISW